MTKKLFWEDPYLTTIETVVESVFDDLVTLRETIFFVFSGGQESDTGTIGGYPVLEARKSGLDLQYILAAGHELKRGDSVLVKIDWELRYWEVPGFARIPCGGTHLKRTGEVGNIMLKRKNIGKGKERIEVYAAAK
jgi:Ser-tRNA(Ala) deacylase AlaX